MEHKIAALTALNSALTVENEDLRSQLENFLDEADGQSTAADLNELQEEFAKRLGAADRNVAELRVRYALQRINIQKCYIAPFSPVCYPMFLQSCMCCETHLLRVPSLTSLSTCR